MSITTSHPLGTDSVVHQFWTRRMEAAELGAKALVSALVVIVLMIAARHLGHRVAGWLAGAPTITGPALVWLAWQNGPDVLMEAALGSVAGCMVCAQYAVVFSRCSGFRRPHVVLGVSLTAAATVLPLVAQLQHVPWVLLPLAGVACSWIVRFMPQPKATGRGGPTTSDIAITAISAGAVSAAVAVAQPQWGAFWAGVLASPPLVAAAIALQRKMRGDQAAVQQFLLGYAKGLVGRVAFAGALVLLVPYLGAAYALAVATVAGVVVMPRAAGPHGLTAASAEATVDRAAHYGGVMTPLPPAGAALRGLIRPLREHRGD